MFVRVCQYRGVESQVPSVAVSKSRALYPPPFFVEPSAWVRSGESKNYNGPRNTSLFHRMNRFKVSSSQFHIFAFNIQCPNLLTSLFPSAFHQFHGSSFHLLPLARQNSKRTD